MDLQLAQIVYSKKGRDSGKKMIIYEIINDKFVMLVDGKLRKVDNPKKKKVKHIQQTNEILEQINAKLCAKDKIFDAEIRKALEVR